MAAMGRSRPHPSDWAGRLGVQQARQLRQAKTLLVQVLDGGHGRVGLDLANPQPAAPAAGAGWRILKMKD